MASSDKVNKFLDFSVGVYCIITYQEKCWSNSSEEQSEGAEAAGGPAQSGEQQSWGGSPGSGVTLVAHAVAHV